MYTPTTVALLLTTCAAAAALLYLCAYRAGYAAARTAHPAPTHPATHIPAHTPACPPHPHVHLPAAHAPTMQLPTNYGPVYRNGQYYAQ